MQKADISGYVLAGGKSRRLQQDKVLLPWTTAVQRTTLLGHAVARLEPVCASVRVCGDRNDFNSLLPASALPPIRDALPNTGPLGGIVAALEQSRTNWNLFLAVDLPLLPAELLHALAARRNQNPLALCILPEHEGLPQPLCGLYHRSLLPGMRRALDAGQYKIMTAVERAAREIAEPPAASGVELLDAQAFAVSLGSATAAQDWFLNINTPEDWRRALERASV